MKKCPFCKEKIKVGAIKCRYCQSDFAKQYEIYEPEDAKEYVIPPDIVPFLKTVSAVLAIMIGIASFGFSVNLWNGARDVSAMRDKVETLLGEARGEAQKIKQEAMEISALRADLTKTRKEAVEALKGIQFMQQNIISERRLRELINAAIASTSTKDQPQSGELIELAFPAGKMIQKTPELEDAIRKMEIYISTSTDFYSRLFSDFLDADLDKVPVRLADPSYKNTFWDGKVIVANPDIQYLPEIIYNENAYRFIDGVTELRYIGQSGALKTAFAAILSELADQHERGLGAKEADWVLAPGAVAWLSDEDIENTNPKLPLRSLREPGSAYRDHPKIGSDTQPSSMNDLYSGVADNQGVHINSGIPAKAFYETALLIGSKATIDIWLRALSNSLPDSDFVIFANATISVAIELKGADSSAVKAIQRGWDSVDMHPRNEEHTTN